MWWSPTSWRCSISSIGFQRGRSTARRSPATSDPDWCACHSSRRPHLFRKVDRQHCAVWRCFGRRIGGRSGCGFPCCRATGFRTNSPRAPRDARHCPEERAASARADGLVRHSSTQGRRRRHRRRPSVTTRLRARCGAYPVRWLGVLFRHRPCCLEHFNLYVNTLQSNSYIDMPWRETTTARPT